MEDKVTKEVAAKGYSEGVKENQKNRIEKVKHMVVATLEKIEATKKVKREAEEVLRILTLDLKDLKEGRLDRIEERQTLQPKAVEISVVHVVKVEQVTVVQDPYKFRWYQPWGISVCDCPITIGGSTLFQASVNNFTVNNSFMRDNVGGTYKLQDGAVVSL